MARVIGYIDGFNLYYGLRDRGWTQFLWLDPRKLAESLLSPQDELRAVKYFTARVRGPDRSKRARQTTFLDAINATSDTEIILGKYYTKPKRCFQCGSTWDSYEEKMTDSAIASHLVADAFRDEYDSAFLIGGDTDIVPAIKMVRRWFPAKRIVVWFPPARRNQEVESHCHDAGTITGAHLAASQMPTQITLPSGGPPIIRPSTWR